MALQSVSHNYSGNLEWPEEIYGMKTLLKQLGNIDDVIGIRAPLLRVGGNSYFKLLKTSRLKYDSSLVSPSSIPSWPYTLDARIPHPCYGDRIKCPTVPVNGFWEFPINELRSPDNTFKCLFFDVCPNINLKGTTETCLICLCRSKNYHSARPKTNANFGNLESESVLCLAALVSLIYRFKTN